MPLLTPVPFLPLLTPLLLAFAPTFCTRQLTLPDAGVWFRLLLLAPLLEEWVVRAGLQEWLILATARGSASAPMRAMCAWPAMPVLASTAAFGLLHLGSGWPAALAVTAPGLVLALVYQHGRDWRWCALVHCLFNLFALTVCIR